MILLWKSTRNSPKLSQVRELPFRNFGHEIGIFLSFCLFMWMKGDNFTWKWILCISCSLSHRLSRRTTQNFSIAISLQKSCQINAFSTTLYCMLVFLRIFFLVRVNAYNLHTEHFFSLWTSEVLIIFYRIEPFVKTLNSSHYKNWKFRVIESVKKRT